MKYPLMIGIGLLCSMNLYAKPSYDVGLSASYEPSVFSNNSVVRASANINNTIKDKIQLGFGVEADYVSQTPTDIVDNAEKVSGYQQTRMITQLGYKLSDNFHVGLYGVQTIDYNENKFGKYDKSVSYGSSIQWIDAQNFAIQANIAKTDYRQKNEDIQLGDILHTAIKFKYGLSSKAQFSIGAVHRKQNASTQKINGQTIVIDKKTSGVGATLGTEYTFDRFRKHHFNFEMQTGIGDLAGHISTGYRYVF